MKLSPRAALAAFFVSLGFGAAPALAQSGQTAEAARAEERLLGSADEEMQSRDLLPFTRSFGTSGTVAGPLIQSAAAAGVPASAMIDAVHALDDATGRTPEDGDTFYVRWQQTYSIDNAPIGIGRVLWLELRTASGATVAIHRFRPREGGERFFLTSGEAATTPRLALPIDDITVSSPFGTRPDPMVRRPATARAMGGPVPNGRAVARGLFAGFVPRLFMHEGVDFAVPQGTPVYAAADGVVAGARPNGGYGNWLQLNHADGTATVYGHLSRFAPRLAPGARVSRGQLVAFSGNTGRSTGPHLHFEVRRDSKPVDPLAHATVAQLGGIDLERFGKQVLAARRERADDDRAAEQAEVDATEATAAE